MSAGLSFPFCDVTIWTLSVHRTAKRDLHIKPLYIKGSKGLSQMRVRGLPHAASTWVEPTLVVRTKPRLDLDTVSAYMIACTHTCSKEISEINLKEKFWISFYFRKRVDCGVPTTGKRSIRERFQLGCYWKFYMRKLREFEYLSLYRYPYLFIMLYN